MPTLLSNVQYVAEKKAWPTSSFPAQLEIQHDHSLSGEKLWSVSKK